MSEEIFRTSMRGKRKCGLYHTLEREGKKGKVHDPRLYIYSYISTSIYINIHGLYITGRECNMCDSDIYATKY